MRTSWTFRQVAFLLPWCAGGASPLSFLSSTKVTPSARHTGGAQPVQQGDDSVRGDKPSQDDLLRTWYRRRTFKRQPIPNLVFFTGPFEPEKVVQHNMFMVPNRTEFRYYNDRQMAQSAHDIAKVLDVEANISGVWEAFTNLRPRAYQSDLWRYLVLWYYGGIYMDAKIMLTANLRNWVDMKKDWLALCHDLDIEYWNGIMAAAPRSPHMELVIKRVVANVQEHFYGDTKDLHADLQITGPGALTNVLRKAHRVLDKPRSDCYVVSESGLGSLSLTVGERLINTEVSYSTKLAVRKQKRDQKGDKDKIISTNDAYTVALLDESTHQGMHACPSCRRYSDLFREHLVYCDEGGANESCPNVQQTVGAVELARHKPRRSPSAPYWSKTVHHP